MYRPRGFRGLGDTSPGTVDISQALAYLSGSTPYSVTPPANCIPSGPLAPGQAYCGGSNAAPSPGTPGTMCFASPLFPWIGQNDLAGNCYDILTMQGVSISQPVAIGLTLLTGFLLFKAVVR